MFTRLTTYICLMFCFQLSEILFLKKMFVHCNSSFLSLCFFFLFRAGSAHTVPTSSDKCRRQGRVKRRRSSVVCHVVPERCQRSRTAWAGSCRVVLVIKTVTQAVEVVATSVAMVEILRVPYSPLKVHVSSARWRDL